MPGCLVEQVVDWEVLVVGGMMKLGELGTSLDSFWVIILVVKVGGERGEVDGRRPPERRPGHRLESIITDADRLNRRSV